MSKFGKETFKFTDVLAMAFASQSFNKKYVKDTEIEMIDNKAVPKTVSNKEIIRFNLSDVHYGMTPETIDLLNKTEITPSKKDKQNSKECSEWLEGLAMRAIAGDLNGFESNLYATFEKDDITTYDFGLIASIPQTYLRTIKRESLEDMILATCTGDWIGSVGTKINTTAKLISGIYSRNYTSYIYVGITNNNQLITFWSQHNWLDKVNKEVKIYAKVKRTDFSRWYDGVKESQLNYVKIT
jgi:hypothetical protein